MQLAASKSITANAMASRLSFGSFKEQFDDQLKCSVCLDQYVNPKTLPCHHSFCLKCIEPLPLEIKQNGKYYLGCPTCRIDHLLPPGGVKNLPNAFHINSLLDLRELLVSSQLPTLSTCPQHDDLLKVYCETCDQVICRDCTISTEHSKHKYQLISECYPKHHQQIREKFDIVSSILTDVNSAITLLAASEREVLKHGENVKEQINEHAQHLIDKIVQSRTRLTQQVDDVVQLKSKTMATQRKHAQTLHCQLKTCLNKVENTLMKGDEQQILSEKRQMIDELITNSQHADPTVFQPIENTKDINFHDNDMEDIGIGTVTSIAFDKATLEVSPCLPKQQSTATLTLHSQDGSPFSLPPSFITSKLCSNGNKHSMKCPITQTQPGKYSITFTPSATRNDQLVVQIGGFNVPNSPFNVLKMPTPERGEPVNIITGLNVPHGLAVCENGDIVVAENGAHCLRVFQKQGRSFKVKTTIDKYVDSPRGIAVSNDGHIIVTDNHRLQKLTTDGLRIESVGSSESGSGQLQFKYPMGIAVHPTTGQIFVADSGNNRIQVFNDDLTFSHSITPGLPHQLSNPRDVAFDEDGNLFATEWGNDCITKFTDQGAYVKRISDKDMTYPFFLTAYRKLLYATNSGSNSVSIYDNSGKFLHRSKGELCKPRGITKDANGNLYVTDISDSMPGNGKIIVFN